MTTPQYVAMMADYNQWQNENLYGAADGLGEDERRREQEYFADGLAEDLITALSRFRNLDVVARNTSFAYKGTSADIRKVREELGVGYVLEGSVRKSGERARVTAQLIDAKTGNHVWAERYDRRITDIFDLQDEVTEKIATAIEPEITIVEIERAKLKKPASVTAWDLYLRGLQGFHLVTKDGNVDAIRQLEASIEREPDYVPALSVLSMCHTCDALFQWTSNRSQAIDAAGELARRAVSIDPSWPQANLAFSWYCMFSEQMSDALKAVRTAIRQEPNSYFAKVHLGGCLAFLGETDEAFEVLESVADSGRRDPWRWLWYIHQGCTQFSAGLFADAVETCSAGKQVRRSWPGFYTLSAAAEAHLGNRDNAERNVQGMLTYVPRMSVLGISRYPMFVLDKDIHNLVGGLRMAGLPETPTN